VVDRAVFDTLPGDASYSRDEAGSWHADWPPSPGAPNLPAGPDPERSRRGIEGAVPVESGLRRLIELEEAAADAASLSQPPLLEEKCPSWPIGLPRFDWWD
jgi:hypothetical protein